MNARYYKLFVMQIYFFQIFRRLPRKLFLNIGLTRVGGTYSTPTSPVPIGAIGRIAPETPTSTSGKLKTAQGAKSETPATYLTPKMQERQVKNGKAAASPSPNEEATRAEKPNKRVMDRQAWQNCRGNLSPKEGAEIGRGETCEFGCPAAALQHAGGLLERRSFERTMIDAEVQVDTEGKNEDSKGKVSPTVAEGLRERLRTVEQDLQALQAANDVPRKRLSEKRRTQDAAVQVNLKPELKTCETQTGAWANSTKELKTLEKTDAIEQWGAIAGKKWSQDLFTNTGTPFETKDDVKKVV
jgi:hypothetical protein